MNSRRTIQKTMLILTFFIGQSITGQEISLKDQVGGAGKRWGYEVTGNFNDMQEVDRPRGIIVLSSDENMFYLKKITMGGTEIWNVSHPIGRTSRIVFRLAVSKSGEAIVVHGGDQKLESDCNWVFDANGELLFSALDVKGYYFPSGSGDYFVTETYDDLRDFSVYDRTGSKLNLNIPPRLKEGRVKLRFLDDDLLIYQERIIDSVGVAEVLMYSFPSMEQKWVHTLESRIWLASLNLINSAYSTKYIALQGTSFRGFGVLVLSRQNGTTELYKQDLKACFGLGFSDDGSMLVSVTLSKYLNIIDMDSGQVADRHRLFKVGQVSGYSKFRFGNDGFTIQNSSVTGSYENSVGITLQARGVYTALVKLDREYKVKTTFMLPGQARYSIPINSNSVFLLRQIGNEVAQYQLK